MRDPGSPRQFSCAERGSDNSYTQLKSSTAVAIKLMAGAFVCLLLVLQAAYDSNLPEQQTAWQAR